MALIHQIRRAEEPKPVRAAEKIKAGLVEAEPVAVHVRRGRKPSGKSKRLLTLRIDPDVIDAYKATGDGWQRRMNDTLRKALGL